MEWLANARDVGIAVALVILNGFFVAAEFALVKVRGGQLDRLVLERRPMAGVARWLGQRLDRSLSACQLGITIASLALGWVGEPAFAHLIYPVFHSLGLSEDAVHATGFVIAFALITGLHLIIGEQAPKIFAIRRPEKMLLWCAPLLAVFYFLAFPLLQALNWSTAVLLRLVGVDSGGDHDSPHTQEEIRQLVTESLAHGNLTRAEHRLIHAVFEFDDLICRRVMVPRNEAVYFTADQQFDEVTAEFRESRHSRYPLCETSLDDVIGILHIKDIVGKTEVKDLRTLARPAHHIPETMPISRLLKHFQATHQLMGLVDDEYGTVIGIVTLENVLEQIVGSVEDEFDDELPPIRKVEEGVYLAQGGAPLSLINATLGVNWDAREVDTVSGLLTEVSERTLKAGDIVPLEGATAEVLEMHGSKAVMVRIVCEVGSSGEGVEG